MKVTVECHNGRTLTIDAVKGYGIRITVSNPGAVNPTISECAEIEPCNAAAVAQAIKDAATELGKGVR